MPRLVKLTGPPQLVEFMLPGSYISSVAILSCQLESINPLLCMRVARALGRTNTSITSLTITYPLVTEVFFKEISDHLPRLRVFNVQMTEVILMASPGTKDLYQWISEMLPKVPHLRKIELRSTPSYPISWQHLQREQEILLRWSEVANNLDICQMPCE
ncbi:hypothetical protein GALMADRAFT_1239581 [Galerina marginata CBS 339.88]|uniref:Uncharacterized protein n=1 Tax=Galerina marginata (strain CBS 339.88) TaxID=685588 RepID=A0A067T8B1_GALM3|nr:hypothetical protein GALMADRAFT_1239581 [Galerina marginata CBS 339.88]